MPSTGLYVTMPSLDEAFKAHPVHPHDHSHLDFGSLTEVPDSHLWSPSPEATYSPNYDSDVPLIDLAGDYFSGDLIRACETWGVFYVKNHGVPMQLIDAVESQARRFFELPVKEKVRVARAADGVAGYGAARISSFFSKLLWSEGFTIVGTSQVQHARQLWPHDYFQFCDVMEEFQREMKKLAQKLMWLILEPLGVTAEDIKWAGPAGDFLDSCACLQLNSYPPCPSPDRVMGLPEHTDSTLFTILHQTNASHGLQVYREDPPIWVNAPPLAGTLIINVGDLLHVLSNGRFRPPLHRALVSGASHRVSIVYLWGPPPDARVSPLVKFVGANAEATYRSVSYLEYLGMKAAHFNKALSFLRLLHPREEKQNANRL